MENKIIILLGIIFGIIIISYLRKKHKKNKYSTTEKCCLADSDWNKIKEIPAISCINCGDCQVESSGCCSNCSANQQYTIEEHCHQHDHSHHHHHEHKHSHPTDTKGLMNLLLIPLLLIATTYRIINYGKKK